MLEQFQLTTETIDRETLLKAMGDVAQGRLDDVRGLPWGPN